MKKITTNRFVTFLSLELVILALLIGLLPMSLTMIFSNGKEEFVANASYYSSLPLGYGVFWPLVSMILGVILVAILLLNIVKPIKPLKFSIIMTVVALLATASSCVYFIMGGLRVINPFALLISGFFLITFLINLANIFAKKPE